MVDWYNSPDPRINPPRSSRKYACFECRKAFSRWAMKNPGKEEKHYFPWTGTCPECGGVTYNMGIYFQPPPKQKRKAWRELEIQARRWYAHRLRFLHKDANLIDPYFTDHPGE